MVCHFLDDFELFHLPIYPYYFEFLLNLFELSNRVILFIKYIYIYIYMNTKESHIFI